MYSINKKSRLLLWFCSAFCATAIEPMNQQSLEPTVSTSTPLKSSDFFYRVLLSPDLSSAVGERHGTREESYTTKSYKSVFSHYDGFYPVYRTETSYEMENIDLPTHVSKILSNKNNTIQETDTILEKEEECFSLLALSDKGRIAAFSKDSKQLAYADRSGGFSLFEKNNETWKPLAFLKEHSLSIDHIAWSTSNIATCSNTNWLTWLFMGKQSTVKIWDRTNNQWNCIYTELLADKNIQQLVFNAEGTRLAVALTDGDILILGKKSPGWDLEGVICTGDSYTYDQMRVACGKADLVASIHKKTGIIKLWHQQGSYSNHLVFGCIVTLQGPVLRATRAEFSPDNTILAIGYEDGTVLFCKLFGTEWRKWKQAREHEGKITYLQFSGNNALVTANPRYSWVPFFDEGDSTIKKWSL